MNINEYAMIQFLFSLYLIITFTYNHRQKNELNWIFHSLSVSIIYLFNFAVTVQWSISQIVIFCFSSLSSELSHQVWQEMIREWGTIWKLAWQHEDIIFGSNDVAFSPWIVYVLSIQLVFSRTQKMTIFWYFWFLFLF